MIYKISIGDKGVTPDSNLCCVQMCNLEEICIFYIAGGTGELLTMVKVNFLLLFKMRRKNFIEK